MATLTIRNIDTTVKEQLRVRAARNGRSMEAELRAIVTAAVGGGVGAAIDGGREETTVRLGKL
jgi:plasmid stability protein